MAKINISFYNNNYTIDDASLSTAAADLKSHLSTVMNGTGATITLGGVVYNIDSTKLSAAEDKFEAYLNGFGGSEEERLEGDGQEFHKFAPCALTFRSTAPLNELQEVQINGVTVDPSNYTLEEGSTIVTLPIEYLNTLDVDNYEITVVSDSKSAKGGFTVVEPELNEHGFYYNQPYTAYVPYYGEKVAFVFREDGSGDFLLVSSGYTEIVSFTSSANAIVLTGVAGTFNATVLSNGTEVYCVELDTTFKLGDESIAADDDHFYVYKEDLGGYEVKAIDETKIEHSVIKTGINGIDTVKLADWAFSDDYGSAYSISIISIKIPKSISYIGYYALFDCNKLTNITFDGTVAQWNAISKGDRWNESSIADSLPVTYVQCSDGTVAL